MLELPLTFQLGVLDNGQAIFKTDGVRQPPQSPGRAKEIPVLPGEVKAGGVIINMIMNVGGVCADFKAILGGAKLPKMDVLKEDGRKLAEQKKKLYAEYRKAKQNMQEVTTVKANIDYLLGYAEPGRRKEQER